MTKHPAKYSKPLLPVMARYVDGARSILDPFAGTGRVGLLREHLTVCPEHGITTNEIEPAWARVCHTAKGVRQALCGDARKLPLFDASVCAIVTSPAYGNRMADAANWAPGRKHSTYTSAIRQTTGDDSRNLQPGNAGAMQWGDEYRELHRAVWAECWRALKPGGRLVLNIADHYRNGELQRVPEWHVSALLRIGFRLLDVTEVETQRYGFGANAEKRAPELVILLYKPPYRARQWVWIPELPRPDLSHPLWGVAMEPEQLGMFT